MIAQLRLTGLISDEIAPDSAWKNRFFRTISTNGKSTTKGFEGEQAVAKQAAKTLKWGW